MIVLDKLIKSCIAYAEWHPLDLSRKFIEYKHDKLIKKDYPFYKFIMPELLREVKTGKIVYCERIVREIDNILKRKIQKQYNEVFDKINIIDGISATAYTEAICSILDFTEDICVTHEIESYKNIPKISKLEFKVLKAKERIRKLFEEQLCLEDFRGDPIDIIKYLYNRLHRSDYYEEFVQDLIHISFELLKHMPSCVDDPNFPKELIC